MKPHILSLALSAVAMLMLPTRAVARAPYPADPLQSPMWIANATTLFGDDPVQFDPRVKISYPDLAENQRSFPVTLDARGIGTIRRMVIFADLNPIPIAIDYRPIDADPLVAIRIKLDQRTPVRGAVQLASGQWLVNGGWVDAAGGGCSAPPLSRVRGDWAQHLGEMRGEAWPLANGTSARLRLSFRHPMDTGLVANIPAYHIEELAVKSAAGKEIARMALWASVAEDPAITLMPHAVPGDVLAVEGRDSNGREYPARIAVPRQSSIPAGATP
jgi:sulfur-oxidizing protein SoxY